MNETSQTSDAPAFFSPSTIQPKLTIGQPNDQYEQEADAMADQVVGQMDHSSSPPAVQTKCPKCSQEESEQVSMKESDISEIQRKPIFEGNDDSTEESTIQRKCDVCGNNLGHRVQTKPDGNSSPVSANLSSQLSTQKGKGSSLPDSTRTTMESSFGTDFQNVKIHTDDQAAEMNQSLGAQAFTHGSDIYFNKGKYQPESAKGQHLLAHELTHTVQQGNEQSPIKNTLSNKHIQRNGGALANATASLTKNSEGPVKNQNNSGFTLNIDNPPPGVYYYFRWSTRDADNNAYLMRSSKDNSVVQYFGKSKKAYINTPSLQKMFEKGVAGGCRVLCRVMESTSPNPPERRHFTPDNSRLFTTNFDFGPDPMDYNRTPSEITALAWTGEIDNVTWIAGAARVGEIDVTSIGQIGTEVKKALPSERHYIKKLTIIGHGFSGSMSPNLTSVAISGPARTKLSMLTPLFGKDSSVRLDGCEVAQGPIGRRFIQDLADLWNVPVSANTSYVHALGWFSLGIEEIARPGEVLESDADILADQIVRTIRETTVITARIVLKQLENAKRRGTLWQTIEALKKKGTWSEVRAQLQFWKDTAVLPWFGEDLSISERVSRLNILNPMGDFIVPDGDTSYG